MRSRHGALLPLVALVLALGCAQDPRVVRLTLLAPEAIGCRPSEVRSVVLTPLADSPSEQRPSLRLDLGGDVERIELFSPATERVAVRAEGVVRMGGGTVPWTGGGIATLGEGGELLVPLLQLRRSCVLGDTRARVLEGAAVVALADGRLLVAGGHEPTTSEVRPTVVLVRPGERLADADAVRLFAARTGASATAVGEELVVIAGGAGAPEGSAFDSFEVIRVIEGAEQRTHEGFLSSARRQHGAARLPDGRVLLVGGRDGVGGALADAELLSIDADGEDARSEPTRNRPIARVSPSVLVLDDGTTLVVGGRDADGAPVAALERFDPDSDGFERLDAALPVRADAAWIRVAGARAAHVGGRDAAGAWSRDVDVWLAGPSRVVTLRDALEVAMESPHASALPDGRVLVVGLDPRTRRAVAQIVDPGGSRDERERAEPTLEPSRLATHLVPLADGSIAEADAEGVSLLRLDTSTIFDDLSASIFPVQIDQRAELSLDAYAHWGADGELFAARVDGARFDLPTSRFAAFEARFDVGGPLEVLLTRDRAAPIVVTVSERELSLEGCRAERGDSASVAIERTGTEVALVTDVARVDCSIEARERLGLAIRAPAGSGVERVSVARR